MITLLLLMSLSEWWQRLTRSTSSHAASARGAAQYQQKKYAEAVKSFDRAEAIAPTARNAFNLGTTQIAAGKSEEGSSTLEKAMRDPALRADALYNRGSSALAAKSYDYAIRDFTEALRIRPGDAQAKRNLEIAIRKKHEQPPQQPRGGGGANNQPQSGPQQPQPAPSPKNPQAKGDPNLDALLRSVQQQEQEELSRMHKAKPERAKVGW